MGNMSSVGEIVKEWRELRRLSQLDLAVEAEISQKHLSFIESGRSAPSREMLLHIADHLDVPLRERNAMLLTAGFAPAFPDRSLNDPSVALAKASVERVLSAHEPFPALAFDRHWNLVIANQAVWSLLQAASEDLLKAPVNILRVSLHPAGLAPYIANIREWRLHLLNRLRRQLRITRDAALDTLLKELNGYPLPESDDSEDEEIIPADAIAIPLRLKTPNGTLSFLSTVTIFGTPLEVTLSELTMEVFYPADEFTKATLSARPSGTDGLGTN
jgi:transcriptional regulator with XRE-family HTH domain